MKIFRNVLVTGGAGYIGSHICKALASFGFRPITYDNLSQGHANFVKWGPLEIGDLCHVARLSQVFEKYSFTAVIHAAGPSSLFDSFKAPAYFYKNHFVSTFNLLEAMRKYHVSHLVFSSSCSVYGIPQKIPISEDEEKHPISPYGQIKSMIEEMLKAYDFSYLLRFLSLRYFNAAGASLGKEMGEDHCPETHLLPSLIRTALGYEDTFTLFGDDHPTKDGSVIRDFIHVDDLAQVHVQALEYLLKKDASDCFNIGTGLGISLLEMIKEVEKVSGKKIPINLKPKREGDPPVLVADSSKAKNLLNFNPSHSELSLIVKTAWNWHNKKLWAF